MVFLWLANPKPNPKIRREYQGWKLPRAPGSEKSDGMVTSDQLEELDPARSCGKKHGGFWVVRSKNWVSTSKQIWILLYQEWLNCGFEWTDLIEDFKEKSKGNLGFSLQPIPDERLANGIGIICHVCPNKHNLVENPYSNWKSVTGYLMDDFPMPTASNLLSPSLPDFVNSETPFCQLVTSSEPAIIYKYVHVCLTYIYIYVYIYICRVYAVYI